MLIDLNAEGARWHVYMTSIHRAEGVEKLSENSSDKLHEMQKGQNIKKSMRT